MQTQELVELAAIVAMHGPLFIRHNPQLPASAVTDYWSLSRCRCDRWSNELRRYGDETKDGAQATAEQAWQRVRPVLEEILASEVLTRVWSAVSCRYDERRGRHEVAPVVRSVMQNHREARNRTLSLMVYGQGFGVEEAVELNRLRRRSERWTDLLLGMLAHETDVREFAFDVRRSEQFAADQDDCANLGLADPARQLMLAALRAAFLGVGGSTANADLNRGIGAAVLACFHADLFDGTGLPRSLWLERLTQVTCETQGMVDQLLSLDDIGPGGAVAERRWEQWPG